MGSIVDVLTQNILPIFLVASLGFLLRRRLGVAPRPIATVVFNGFSPSLVFISLTNSSLPVDELGQLALFALANVLAMGLLGFAIGRIFRFERNHVVVLMLVLMFVNSGNYGLTLNQLRYGEAGLGRAVVYYVVSSILVYTVGVFIVSMGRRSWKASLQKLARVPAVYAVAAAILVYSFALPVPSPVMRAIDITADGAIPAMLVVLGMNLADLDSFANFRFAAFATSIRLLGGPLVAFAIAETLGLQGLSRATSIIEASMPTAVMTTVIATEFDVRPPLVTSVVILTTLASPFTLAFFISALNL